MRKITIMIGLFLLLALNVSADDVTIDSNGNVKTGVAGSANLEVSGASAETAISGLSSGTGGVGVSGANSTYGNYGLLGYDSYGVYGFSSGGYAGYFDGNVHVTGNLTVQGNINIPETDPQVGTLTNRMWCTSNGSQVDCTTAAPVTIEFDPQVGTLTSGKWCVSDGSAVNCATNAPVTAEADPTVPSSVKDGVSWTEVSSRPEGLDDGDDVGLVSESDPQVGNNAFNHVPKWNGSALVWGQIYDDGLGVGIGTSSPDAKLHIAGGGWNSLRIDGTQPFITLNSTDTFQSGINFMADGSDKWAIMTDVSGYSVNNFSIIDRAAGSTRLFIDPYGNIGVGTTAPDRRLDVAGTVKATTFEGSDSDGDFNATRDTANAWTNAWFRVFTNGTIEQLRINDGDEAGIYGDGTFTSNGIDYAEAFKISDQTLEAGDVVVLNLSQPEFIQRAKRPYASNLVGVISGKPGFLTGQSFDVEEQADTQIAEMRRQARIKGDSKEDKRLTGQLQESVRQQYRAVALAGRVPVKVDGANGPVKPGDRLTSSPIPGYAMAMKEVGQSIGIAMEAWEKDSRGMILVLVQPGWWSPSENDRIDW